MPRPRRPSPRPLGIIGSHWREDGRPKVRYPSRSDALFAAEERTRDSGTALGVYVCEICGGWHMGRQGGRARA